jgi:hypothetical protein
MREIKIVTTKGVGGVITTDVTTWAELKPLVERNGQSLSNMQATENINKTTLENDAAVLPEGNFALFLRPIKTKAGVSYATMSRKELTSCLTAEQKEGLKNTYGKNWTNCTTEDIRSFLMKQVGSSTTKTTTKVVAKTTAKAITTKSVAKSNSVAATANDSFSEQDATEFISKLESVAASNSDLALVVSETVENINNIVAVLKGEMDASEVGESEDEKLMREFQDLERGFKR